MISLGLLEAKQAVKHVDCNQVFDCEAEIGANAPSIALNSYQIKHQRGCHLVFKGRDVHLLLLYLAHQLP